MRIRSPLLLTVTLFGLTAMSSVLTAQTPAPVSDVHLHALPAAHQ